MHDYFKNDDWIDRVRKIAWDLNPASAYHETHMIGGLPNVWLGVSVEDQKAAEERIPYLLETPAAIRWISAEPLLGAIDLTKISYEQSPGYFGDALQWYHRPHSNRNTKWNGLNWVVVGGESGPNARPMHPDLARTLRDQCIALDVPFFFKQWGEFAPESSVIVDGSPGSMTFLNNSQIEICERGERLYRVGKKRTNRLLDGQEWNQYPS